MLVAQSFHIFNRYGKDNSALKDITRAFIEDLTEYSQDEITHGFKAWRKSHDGMPTPANIINQIKERKEVSVKSGLKKYSEFEGGWQDYCRYLNSHGVLSQNIIYNNGSYDLKPGYHPDWKEKDFK